MHLSSRMIKGGDTEEVIFVRLVMMPVFVHTGKLQVPVGEEYGFRGASGPGGEVEPSLVSEP